MSNFYKIIHIENIKEIQQEIISIFPNKYYGKSELFAIYDSANCLFKLSKLKELLDSLDISIGIKSFEFVVMQPGDSTGIHTDSDDFQFSLNIPLTDCENTYLSFYKCKLDSDKEYVYFENPTNNDIIYFKPYSENECEFIESSVIKDPYILNTDILHNLENKSNKEQIMILIRIFHNVDYTVKKLLSNP